MGMARAMFVPLRHGCATERRAYQHGRCAL
jgi:hypothetical protein